jgi:hypothetical protein
VEVAGVVSGAGVSLSTAFTTPGVYSITLTVTDPANVSASCTFVTEGAELAPAYIVIYDPAGGFVTGGGWIDSPVGAYAPNPTLSGKANFGFVSKYQKGATIPTGETEFQFKVGNLNFHSTVYEWLVVSGPLAQYKGSGQINGAGNYGFLLTATDGQVSGGGGVDKFRIKIWDRSNADQVVYDNVVGGADGSAQAIGGGSIVVKK